MEYVRVRDASPTRTLALDVGMIRAIASWCEFLQGNSTAVESLECLARASNVDVVTLGRIQHDALHKSNAVSFDTVQPTLGIPSIDRTFAGELLGSHTRSASPGTIWFGSMLNRDPDSMLSGIQRVRGFAEIAIIPLSQTGKQLDVLEFHLSTDSVNHYHVLLNMIAGTLADTWHRRRAGLLTELMLARPARDEELGGPLVPLLAVENPARLSRAEFRVCLLLAQGLNNDRVMDELEISLPTLRTHLRNIYAKTGALGHSDLLYKLLNFAPLAEKQRKSIA